MFALPRHELGVKGYPFWNIQEYFTALSVFLLMVFTWNHHAPHACVLANLFHIYLKSPPISPLLDLFIS